MKPCWAEEPSRSILPVCPPMPAPPSSATSSLVVSADDVVCVAFHVAVSLSAAAADLNASSLDLIEDRSSLWAWTLTWRIWTAVTLFCSSAMSWEMIVDVSRPEAKPVSVMPAMGGDSLELCAGHDVQRLRGRNGLDHVALEVADLDDDAIGRLVTREVKIEFVLVQVRVRRRGRARPLASVGSRGAGQLAE